MILRGVYILCVTDFFFGRSAGFERARDLNRSAGNGCYTAVSVKTIRNSKLRAYGYVPESEFIEVPVFCIMIDKFSPSD